MTTPGLFRDGIPPDFVTAAAFGGVVVFGGLNIVAVRYSSPEIAPFLGAGVRFAFAGLVMLGIMVVWRIPFPGGRALLGSVLYGFFAFALAFGLGYWALQELPASIAALILAAIPLLTLFLATVHGIETFSWRGLAGGAITLAGIALLVGNPQADSVPILPLLAMVGAAASLSEAGIVIKKFPPCHPAATNTIGLGIGAGVLLLLSLILTEQWAAPNGADHLVAFAYLVVVGTVAVFGLYLYVLGRWTASRASYQFVLIPFVAALVAAWLLDESISGGLIIGGAIVLAGVYVGALSTKKPKAPTEPEHDIMAMRCSTI